MLELLIDLLLSPLGILIAAAAIPAIALLVYVYRHDTVEKESPSMIVSLLLLGGAAAILAILGEWLGGTLLDSTLREGMLYLALYDFVVVALVEEACKFLLLKKRTWNSPEFNYSFDGVVYAVCVSMGFALLENVFYVLQNGLTVALLRAVTAIPGHGCFGVFMGCWYAQALAWRRAGDAQRSRLCLWLTLIIPALLHGAYDFLATIMDQFSGGAWLFFGFVAVMFFITFRVLKRLSGGDARI